MSERGMKRWLPFKSLVEQGSYLDKLIYEKYKIDKPQVSVEQAEKIDRILKEYDKNSELKFKLYIDGYLYIFTGKIERINKQKKLIYLNDLELPIKNIIDIEDPNPFAEIA